MSNSRGDLISNAEAALERAANRAPVYDRMGPGVAADDRTIRGMAQQIIDLQRIEAAEMNAAGRPHRG